MKKTDDVIKLLKSKYGWEDINTRLVKDTIKAIEHIEITGNSEKKTDPNIIPALVKRYYNLKSFNTSSRKREYVKARQITAYLLDKYKGIYKWKIPYRKIAEMSGMNKHSTAISSIKTTKNLIDTDKRYRAEIKEIELLTIY